MKARRWTSPVTGDDVARLSAALLIMAFGLAALALVAIMAVPFMAVGWVAYQVASATVARTAGMARRPWPSVVRRLVPSARRLAVPERQQGASLRTRRNVGGGD